MVNHSLSMKILCFTESKSFIFLIFLLGIPLLSLFLVFFSPLALISSFLGLAFLVLLYKYPEISVIALITFNVTFFKIENLPRLPLFGEASLLPGEVLILLTIAILIIKNIKDPNFFQIKSFFFLPYLILFFIWGFSIYLSLAYGFGFTETANTLRSCFYHIIFFLVILTIRDQGQLKRLLCLLYGLGVVITLLFAFMVLFGGAKYFTAPVFSVVVRELRAYDIGIETVSIGKGRICTDGPYLVSALFFIALTTLINTRDKKQRLIFTILSLLFLLTIILTFGRMLWLTSIIGLCLIYLLSNQYAKRYLLKYVAVLMVLALLVSVALSLTPLFTKGGSKSLLGFAKERFVGLFTKTTKEDSFKYRYWEAKKGMEVFKKHPFWGNGFPYYIGFDLRQEGDVVLLEKLGVGHNGYLDILCRTGMVGLVAYLCLSFYVIKISLKYFRMFSDPILLGLVLGLLVNYIRVMLNATSQSDFLAYHCGSVIALSFGLIDVSIRTSKREDLDL
ncbi:O-antigen ligase family protein [bacterium]|nr:O-antigen ligase family protein [bacterium]MBU1153092.1 O-antigen ligase family protein [bacterium]